MKALSSYIIVTLFLCFCKPAMAQQYNSVYDVFTNESYNYQSKYKEVKDVGLNLNDEIGVNYFAFRNKLDDYSKMNTEIEQLALNSWQNDQSKLKLQNEVKAVLANYNKFKYSKNNKQSRGLEGKFGDIELKDIEVDVLAVCNEIITFKQVFEFSVASRSNYNQSSLEINVSHYYTYDIIRQKRSEIKYEFNDKEITILKQFVDPYVIAFNKEIKTQFSEEEIQNLNENLYDDEDNEEADEDKLINRNIKLKSDEEKLKDIDYNEANFYWYAWGLMIQFPAYCKSTNISNGLSFNVFLPYNECKVLLDLFPNYQSYERLFKPMHNFNKFDYFEIINNYSKFRQEPKITNLFSLNNALDEPKKLTVASYQTFKDHTKNHRGNFIYDFDVRAKNFQKHASSIDFTAYYENYNGKLTLKKNNFKPDKNNLVYDERGNLIIKKMNDLEAGGDFLFFYNQSQCYYFRQEKLSDENQEKLMQISLNKGEICLSDVCLTLDENMHVCAVKSTRNTQNDLQLGFDHKNRLVEAHSENDRYNYYYQYDELDRLIKYSYYEYSRVEKEVEFFYQDQKRLPFLQKKHTVTHETFEEESYEWEY